jgi:phosphatidylglycerophosphate synthase
MSAAPGGAPEPAGRDLVEPGRPTFHDAYGELARARKGRGRGAPAYSLYVNRPLGRVFAAGAVSVGWGPNTVSLLSAGFTFTAIALIAAVPPSGISGIIIALLLMTGYALDSADGQVARFTHGGSAAGEWLDHVLDACKNCAIHLALLISAFRWFDLPSAWLLVPLAFAVVSSTTFTAMVLKDLLPTVGRRSTQPSAGPGRQSTPARSLLGLPTDYGVLCLSFAILGWPTAFWFVYVLLFIAHTAYLMLAAPKWFRDLQRLIEAE